MARWLVRCYPRMWRRRYENEILALLDEAGTGWRQVADLAQGVVREWLDPCQTEAAGDRGFWRQSGRWLLVAVRAYVAMCLACGALILAEWLSHESLAALRHPASLGLRDLVQLGEQMSFSLSTRACLIAAVLYGYSLLWSAPIGWLLSATGVGRTSPRVALVLWMAAFQLFTTWIAVRPFGWRDRGVLALAAAGWVLGRAMFPRSVHVVQATP